MPPSLSTTCNAHPAARTVCKKMPASGNFPTGRLFLCATLTRNKRQRRHPSRRICRHRHPRVGATSAGGARSTPAAAHVIGVAAQPAYALQVEQHRVDGRCAQTCVLDELRAGGESSFHGGNNRIHRGLFLRHCCYHQMLNRWKVPTARAHANVS